MRDPAYVFTIFFLTLGPLKIIPAVAMATAGVGWRGGLATAVKAALLSTAIALAIFYGGNHVVAAWRVSVEAIGLAGGVLLFVTALKTITTFSLAEMPPATPAAEAGESAGRGWRMLFGLFERPVLSPIVIPATITPIGVVALFYFAAATYGDPPFQHDILLVLLEIMALNFLAMVFARPILQAIGLPVLQAIGWVMSALQAALALQIILGALRRRHVLS
jgi:multiple antibiotic resistance protein